MANQTELLNVSDEMKLDDERQSFEGLECGEGLCSSSSDTTEELYSSSAPDTCGDCRVDVKGKIGIAVKRLIQLTKSIVLVTEMPLQASISASSNKGF